MPIGPVIMIALGILAIAAAVIYTVAVRGALR